MTMLTSTSVPSSTEGDKGKNSRIAGLRLVATRPLNRTLG